MAQINRGWVTAGGALMLAAVCLAVVFVATGSLTHGNTAAAGPAPLATNGKEVLSPSVIGSLAGATADGTTPTSTTPSSDVDICAAHKTEEKKEGDGNLNFWIGFSLACSSSIFIGASFIFKKKGLINLTKDNARRAGEGGVGYLKEPMWWAGLILMASGEAANFTAYAFAPASLVTPLGALSVLVSAILASYFLAERLNLIGKVGCLLSVLGATVIVIHSPKEPDVKDMECLQEMMKQPVFIVYCVLVVVVAGALWWFVVPKYGQSNVLVYIMICSVIGSLSVMGCKGIGIAITQTVGGNQQFDRPITYICIVQVAVCIAVQINFLNRALDTFNTSIVTPVYYVAFTTFVIIASSILFREWTSLTAPDILGNICGFATVVCGVFLLHAFRDVKVGWGSVKELGKGKASARPIEMETVLGDEEEVPEDKQSLIQGDSLS